jgi:F0F1-type ATP synthase gamma subunit
MFDEAVNTQATRELVILITSDKGLCGPSNSKVLKEFSTNYQDLKDTTDVFVIGKK